MSVPEFYNGLPMLSFWFRIFNGVFVLIEKINALVPVATFFFFFCGLVHHIFVLKDPGLIDAVFN